MKSQTDHASEDRKAPLPSENTALIGQSDKEEPGLCKKPNGEPIRNLDLILDIPVTLSVELGKTRMVIEEILQLGQGSVLELDKLAGDPLDILVQGRPIGKGEVVVVNEKLGIRLTDIISPAERIQKLG